MKNLTRQTPSLQNQFERIVADMDLPDVRKAGSYVNASWFIRDGWLRNKNHRNFSRAREIAIKLSKLN